MVRMMLACKNEIYGVSSNIGLIAEEIKFFLQWTDFNRNVTRLLQTLSFDCSLCDNYSQTKLWFPAQNYSLKHRSLVFTIAQNNKKSTAGENILCI